jgi:hypothetical protein
MHAVEETQRRVGRFEMNARNVIPHVFHEKKTRHIEKISEQNSSPCGNDTDGFGDALGQVMKQTEGRRPCEKGEKGKGQELHVKPPVGIHVPENTQISEGDQKPHGKMKGDILPRDEMEIA